MSDDDRNVTATLKIPRRIAELFERIHEVPLTDVFDDAELWAEIEEVFGEYDEEEQEPFEGELEGMIPANPVDGRNGTVCFRIEPSWWWKDEWEDEEAVMRMEFLLEFEGNNGDMESVSQDSGYYEWQEYSPSDTEDVWQELYWSDLDTQVAYSFMVVLGD